MTTTVTIHFAPIAMMMTMYTHGDTVAQRVRAALREGLYTEKSAEFIVEYNGEEAAEEAFDLTNNPCRQEEREQVYGRGRSLSVGDIVDLGEEKFVCMPFGWVQL